MVAHSALTGADLHEPKGVSGAGADTVYVATGSGSGAWAKVDTDALDLTSVDARYVLLSNLNLILKTGTGTPESVVTAAVGSIYLRTDGGASTTLYVKETGAGNTGWVAK